MFKKKLDPKLQLNHYMAATLFICSSVCVTCQLKEGGCISFRAGRYKKQYKACWHYRRAVNSAIKILDKYDC